MGKSNRPGIAVVFAALLAACGNGGHDMSQHDVQLAAPTELAAAAGASGVHLTWKDNSSGEEEFMVMRRDASSGWGAIGSAAANATSFHDGNVARPGTYTYMVHAMSGASTSPPSNEVTVALP